MSPTESKLFSSVRYVSTQLVGDHIRHTVSIGKFINLCKENLSNIGIYFLMVSSLSFFSPEVIQMVIIRDFPCLLVLHRKPCICDNF